MTSLIVHEQILNKVLALDMVSKTAAIEQIVCRLCFSSCNRRSSIPQSPSFGVDCGVFHFFTPQCLLVVVNSFLARKKWARFQRKEGYFCPSLPEWEERTENVLVIVVQYIIGFKTDRKFWILWWEWLLDENDFNAPCWYLTQTWTD